MSAALVVELVAGAAGLVVGAAIGILIGRSHRRGADPGDWRMRMAARDRDLADAVGRLADAEIELQALRERLGVSATRDPEAEAQITALTEELHQADDELTRLRSLGVDQSPAASSALASRLEALEVELATLASMRCPDPAAHRTGRARRTGAVLDDPAGADPTEDDDLTRITGVGPGLARIFRALGYRTFADIARLTDRDLEEIAAVAGGIAGPSAREGWVESARRLASHDAA